MNRSLCLSAVALLCCTALAAQAAAGGLASSAWPKAGQNLGNTCLSPSAGPDNAAVKWKINIGGPVTTPPALTADGDLCLAAGDRLFVIGPDGKTKYQYLTASMGNSAPAVSSDGTIYVGSAIGRRLVAIPPGPPKDGVTPDQPSLAFAWKVEADKAVHSSPSIGPDGTIYFGSDDGNLYAVNKDGTVKWKYAVGGPVQCSPALAADGTIYVNEAEMGMVLHALGPDGKAKWTADLGWGSEFSPAVRPDGSVVLCAGIGQVIAVAPDGKSLWVYEPPDDGGLPSTPPAIGSKGGIYYGTDQGSLAALTPDGKPAWNTDLADQAILGGPVIDSAGVIYLGTQGGALCAISPDGKIKWKRNLGSPIVCSPVIGSGGVLYVGCHDGGFYAIGR